MKRSVPYKDNLEAELEKPSEEEETSECDLEKRMQLVEIEDLVKNQPYWKRLDDLKSKYIKPKLKWWNQKGTI